MHNRQGANVVPNNINWRAGMTKVAERVGPNKMCQDLNLSPISSTETLISKNWALDQNGYVARNLIGAKEIRIHT